MLNASKSNQIKITVSPWSSDNCFEIQKLQMHEELGGNLANGEIEFIITSTEDQEILNKLTEETSGEIRIEDLRSNGLKYTIPIFVTSRCWKIASFNISFVCVTDSSFFTKVNVNSFDNISVAINSLYPGKEEFKDIRIDPDSSISNLPIYQRASTNYELCTNLCQSYKKDTIFCYGWEGLMIKELCGEFNSYGKKDSINIDNPSILVTSLEMGSLYPTEFNYDKYLNVDPKFPEVTTKFCSSTMYYTDYYIQRSGFENLFWNKTYNQKLMNGKLYSTEIIKGIHMPRYKIGDVITYVISEPGPKSPYFSYLCYSNDLFYSVLGASSTDENGFKVSWETKLVGLTRGTWSNEKDEEEV